MHCAHPSTRAGSASGAGHGARSLQAGFAGRAIATALGIVLALGGAGGFAGSAQAAPAHEHGVVRADLAIGRDTLNLSLETPLDNLLGFERAPRNPAERQQVAAALATLRLAATWLRVDPAAGCQLARVSLRSSALGLGDPSRPADAAEPPGHADLDAEIDFHCRDTRRARHLDIDLFTPFAGMQRIELQIAGEAGQHQRTLRRPDTRVPLAP
jgi:hypothetical protein